MDLIKAGETIISFLDSNFFKYGYKGKVIIESSKVDTFKYIQATVKAANNSVNRDHYLLTFDGEDNNYQNVISILSGLTNHRVYETGITICSGKTFYTAIQNSINGKSNGEHAKRVAVSMGVTMAKVSTSILISKVSTSSIDKCDCDYHRGGCMISWPAPSKKACQ
ncbi:hypothetical protein I4U23_005518 [Adineta vaga]|nr:hypothetical protein I4U23_005518 [Adineta vaga]